jgi:two-component system, NarL family, invasion response regulator UvrY
MTYIHGKTLIKIAVTDDHIMLRETLCNVIDTWENCKVILQADNGKHFMSQLDPTNLPDLVLMDLEMPEMDGYETIKAIKKIYPDIKIMVLSMYQSEEAIIRSINVGAQGFFNKSGLGQHFKNSVYEMMRTGYSFADRFASRLVKQAIETGKLTSKNDLSAEELTFLKNVITEKTYQKIADIMIITQRRTEYLRNKMFEHFDVQNRIGLATLVIKKGLVV